MKSKYGIDIFPEFNTLYALIHQEVHNLNDQQLDYTSSKWEWSEWSTRNQISHMASVIPRWLAINWKNDLFPNDEHGFTNIDDIANSPYDRRLNDDIYWNLNSILEVLETWINLSIKILNEKTEEYLNSRTVGAPPTPQWLSMSKAHPRGVTAEGDPASRTMTLEATFRHIYFEETTHLFNIQRLKKAQNLDTKVTIPKVGYWMLDGWDRSDP